MTLPISALTPSRLTLLTHAERLQTAGYLAGAPLDFRAIRDQSIQEGINFLRYHREQIASSQALPLGEHSLDMRIQGILREARGIMPRSAADFHPREFILPNSEGRDMPVVAEKVEVAEALDVVSPEYRIELRPYEHMQEYDGSHPFVFLFRGWDGIIHGMCIVALDGSADAFTMLCCRDVKFKRGEGALVRNLGVAMVISRLLYLHDLGLLQRNAPALTGIIPPVLKMYRESLRVPHYPNLVWDEESVCPREAELILSSVPTSVIRV